MANPLTIADYLGQQPQGGLSDTGDTDLADFILSMANNQGQTQGGLQPQNIPTGDLSNAIQEALGAKSADSGGQIAQILSGRFQSPPASFADTGEAALKGAISGNYITGEDVQAQRGQQWLSTLSNIQKLDLVRSQIEKNNALARAGGIKPGATMQAFAVIKAAHPEIDDMTALSMAQKGVGMGNTFANGGIAPIPGALETTGAIKYAEKTGTETAEADVKKREGYTKAQSAIRGFEQQANLVTGTIDKATALINKSGSMATGYGQSFSGLPNTDSRALNNYLNTIKANVGFDQLQKMRDNSPTGGALGQVSDFENRLLQAVQGALDPLQSKQLKENLSTIKELYPQVLLEKQRAFQQDYGTVTPIGNNPIAQGSLPPLVNPSQPKQAPDGNYYFPDPNRPGKYLRVDQ